MLGSVGTDFQYNLRLQQKCSGLCSLNEVAVEIVRILSASDGKAFLLMENYVEKCSYSACG